MYITKEQISAYIKSGYSVAVIKQQRTAESKGSIKEISGLEKLIKGEA